MKNDVLSRVLAQAGKVVESRSSVLVPLHWITAILVSFLLLSVVTKAPAWMEIGLFVLLTVAILQSILSYNYFMIKNPDALRSEKHVQVMQAIEKGLYGDSDMGMLVIPKLGNELLLPRSARRNVTLTAPKSIQESTE